MTKPATYYGFCPYGHGGVVTVKTTLSLEHQRNHCVHCGSGLVMGSTKEQSFILSGERK